MGSEAARTWLAALKAPWARAGPAPRLTRTTPPPPASKPSPYPAGLTPADTARQRTEAVDGGALIPADLPDALPVDNLEQKQALAPVHQAQTAIKTIPFRQAATAIAQAAQRLYNLRPAWLAAAHAQLDAAVAAAYGWGDYTADMPDDEILRRLLALNLERSAPPRSLTCARWPPRHKTLETARAARWTGNRPRCRPPSAPGCWPWHSRETRRGADYGAVGVGQRDAAIEWWLLDARVDWIEAFWEV